MELVRIELTEAPGTLRLVGEIDVQNVDEAQARLEEELLRCRQLTLDASEVSFMDLRMLLLLGEQAVAKAFSIVVLNCSKAVQRVLDVSVPQGIPGVETLREDT